MNVIIVDDVKKEELRVGDVVEIEVEYGYKLCYLLELNENNKYVLRNFNGLGFFTMKDTIDEIIQALKKDCFVKSYRIFSEDEYDLVLKPKEKTE
jgi:hypothetical protein